MPVFNYFLLKNDEIITTLDFMCDTNKKRFKCNFTQTKQRDSGMKIQRITNISGTQFGKTQKNTNKQPQNITAENNNGNKKIALALLGMAAAGAAIAIGVAATKGNSAKLADINFNKGFATLKNGEEFTGKIKDTLKCGDLIEMKYKNGILQKSKRTGSKNFIKEFYTNKDCILPTEIITKKLNGRKTNISEIAYKYVDEIGYPQQTEIVDGKRMKAVFTSFEDARGNIAKRGGESFYQYFDGIAKEGPMVAGNFGIKKENGSVQIHKLNKKGKDLLVAEKLVDGTEFEYYTNGKIISKFKDGIQKLWDSNGRVIPYQ